MKKLISIVAIFAMCMCLVACGAKEEPAPEPTPEPASEKMSMTYVGLKVYDPVYVALEKGFFEEEGLEVKLTDVVAGREPLRTQLGGKVPIVIVDHKDHDEDIYGTITHNRARGQHLLEPMKRIIQELLDSGKTVPEISKQLGMKPEEIFRLSGFSREDFLNMLIGEHKKFSEAYIIKEV